MYVPRDHAMSKLLASNYGLIISNVHLAEMDDFLLLKRNQGYQPYVPVVLTAGVSDRDSAGWH